MDILKSNRLAWTIHDGSLNEEEVVLDGHIIRRSDLDLLNQPYQLRTPNLVLYLQPIKYAHESDHVEFPTGNVVTPLQILGAIYTYYNLPLTKEELDQLEAKAKGDPSIKDIIDEARVIMARGGIVPRTEIMGSDIFFEGLSEYPNGDFDVTLGS